ncbi:MAG TPA: PEP-utilizing enzyme [Candidatus Saccharimonadales bacterium]|nr:PEP-utilizing enzyme [Candidatus Saccharimonadales bacterium]
MESKNTNLIKATNKINWILITHKQYPLFSRYWISEAFRVDMKKALGLGFNNYKSLYSGVYADKSELGKLSALLISRLEKDTGEIWMLCRQWQRECNEVVEFSRMGIANPNKISDKELLKYLDSLVEKLRKSAAYIFLHHVADPYFENRIIDMLNKRNISKSLQKSYFQVLTTPTKKTAISQSQIELLSLSKKVKKYGIKSCQNFIEQYAAGYAWLGYDTAIGSNLTVQSIKEKLKNYNSKKHDKRQLKRKVVESHLSLAPREIDLINLISEISYLGTYRTESHAKVGVYLRPVLNELANRLDSTYEELVQFTLPEIKKFMQLGKLDNQLAKSRNQKFGLITFQGKQYVVSGNEVDKFEPQKSSHKDSVKILKGMIVNMGEAIGNAKIVLNKGDFAKVKNGDILIAKMTNTDYIPVLQKCAAIVTDIGGITSHAAIISREMRKPCITGTKIATQVFRDGDMIEVDAINGVVRKL